MDNAYTKAAFEADLPAFTKLVLLGLIYHMNNDSHDTFVGTKKLRLLCGMSHSAAVRHIDALEESGILQHVGWVPKHPGSSEQNKLYKIHLSTMKVHRLVALSRGGSGELPQPSSGELPVVAESYANSTHSGSQPSAGSGVDVALPNSSTNEVEKPHTYTAPRHTNSKNNTGTDQTPTKPQGSVRKSDDPFWEGQFSWLLTAFLQAAEPLGIVRTTENWQKNWLQLEAYRGNLPPARLAQLMWWAFRLSKHWSNPSTWKTLDMENFLRASGELDKQAQKFPHNQKWVQQFSSVTSVLDWLDAEQDRKETRQPAGKPKPAVSKSVSAADVEDVRRMVRESMPTRFDE